jgi:copper chaperone CopZ
MSEKSGGTTEEVVMHIEGMSCMHCVGRVESGLRETEGIVDAKVSLEDSQAVITFERTKISAESIRAKISEIGYRAT